MGEWKDMVILLTTVILLTVLLVMVLVTWLGLIIERFIRRPILMRRLLALPLPLVFLLTATFTPLFGLLLFGFPL